MVEFYFRNDWLDGRRLAYRKDNSENTNSANTPRTKNPKAQTVKPFRKVLYEKQDIPDNYTSDSVLELIEPSSDSADSLDFKTAVRSTACILQHGSACSLLVLTWHAVRWHHLSVNYVLGLDLLLLVIGYKARNLLVSWKLREEARDPSSPRQINSAFFIVNKDRYLKDATTALSAFGTLLILSPVLRTLTLSWSEDTIYAMTVVLFIMHLLIHDYKYIYRERDAAEKLHDNINDLSRVWREIDNSVALNAAMFAAIILASRLDTVTDVFGFIFLSITVFMMIPTAQKCVYIMDPNFYSHEMTVLIYLGTQSILYLYGGVLLAGLYMFFVIFICLVCPFLFIRSHSLRTELRGPWDIAHVEASRIDFTPKKNMINFE